MLTDFEAFIRDLLIADLSEVPTGALKKEITKFRTKGAPWRLASLMLGHPDEKSFIQWSDLHAIKERADRFFGSSHRFAILSQHKSDFEKVKTIRNAVAHQGEKAWGSFSLCSAERMKMWPISPRVNDPKNDDEGILLIKLI
jgi:hypothetical protein